MHVAFDFHPDDGPAQTLYSDMRRGTMERIIGIMSGLDAEDTTLTLRASTRLNGPARDMVFRASRITNLRKAR